ncbi:hypothetical protein TRFO_27304 [Tritrichomonas foetus]|uniref:Chaperone DnaJ C-terminal domain-containing protein n=1 Tax=Tritrichomonas foetus TaxID=1144522 RepID=A0A1J4K161_9EUKA|nr:hypothetical protein TRFO_27304 [Tritrichomonas foetus]|eukprot:OHT05119.1 hypothetical protein TRFO_27304 [Tritrichomonas foetus]
MLLLFLASVFSFDDDTDLYELTGIPYSASTQEIRDMASNYLNDSINSNNEVLKAYKILNNTSLRHFYDLYGMDGINNPDKHRGFNKPLKKTQMVPIYDFYAGVKYTYILSRSRVCKCPNPGFMCSFCHGSTTVIEDIPITFELKRGATDPIIFVIPNITDSSEYLEPSNLKFIVKSAPDPFTLRKGNDIHITSSQSLDSLYPGFNLSYQFIDHETYYVNVTEVSSTIVVPGRGMPIEGTEKYGNLYIHFIY